MAEKLNLNEETKLPSKQERLTYCYELLTAQPPATSFKEIYEQLLTSLRDTEKHFSVPEKERMGLPSSATFIKHNYSNNPVYFSITNRKDKFIFMSKSGALEIQDLKNLEIADTQINGTNMFITDYPFQDRKDHILFQKNDHSGNNVWKNNL